MTSPKRWILSFIFTVLCLKKSLLIRIIISISIIVRFSPAFRSSSLLLSLFFFLSSMTQAQAQAREKEKNMIVVLVLAHKNYMLF